MSVEVAFAVLATLLTVIDFYVAYRSFQNRNEMGRWLGISALLAGVVTISYLCSVWNRSYLNTSIASSCYFASIDWMLVSLLHFVYVFTGGHTSRRSQVLRRCVVAYALFDTAVMVVNVFVEIAVSYPHRDTVVAPFTYEMKPLYFMHLGFTYLLVAIILAFLILKCTKTPRQYRNQYTLTAAAIIVVIILNAMFLYPRSNEMFTLLDYSLVGYSLGLIFTYWAAFDYRASYMPKSLSMTIFEKIDQGLVLFDYNDQLIMRNNKADQLLTDVSFPDGMHCSDFAAKCGLPEPNAKDAQQYSVQLDMAARRGRPLRCDYRQLLSSRGDRIGKLFVFTDISNDIDLLTGFQHWENFRRLAAESPYEFDHPTSAVVFDIIGLGEVNRTFGHEVGNQRIRHLARSMRQHMPDDAYFVRGYEAHLVAVCRHCAESEALEMAQKVLETSGGTVMFGVSCTFDSTQEQVRDLEGARGRNVINTIEMASRAMQVKKLLSAGSVHSQALTSLVRALRESDSDTEEHVQRTQKMGMELGRRVGLTDAQIADLRLLCLLHDIGKIGIPLEILNKPGKLSEQEWAVLRTHPEKGYQICMTSDELKHIARMVLYHHERWDGRGYPERLAGNNIPVLSRVISIVDAYDAMVNDRPYRNALSPEAAQDEIRRCAGTQFDPNLAEEFLAMLEEHPEIAVGESVGGEEVAVFVQRALDMPVEQGNTSPLLYTRYVLDMNDVIIEVDGNFEQVTGYSEGDVVGKVSQFDLVPAEDRVFYTAQVSEQFMRGEIACLKHEIMRKDGTKIWVACYGKHFYDSATRTFRSEIVVHQIDPAD